MNTRRLGRLFGATVAAAGTVAAMSACGLIGGGTVPTAEVGECLNTSDIGTEVSEIPTVDCSEEHDGQIFHKEDLPDGDFPGEDGIEAAAIDICYGDNFTNFVGLSYEESTLEAFYISPTEDTWNQNDDREILCLLQSPEPVTESLEGSNV